MKIKFKKLEATPAFIKLFGVDRAKPADSGASNKEETGDVYEYYYKRGNTYYFRNEGNKFSIDINEPKQELVRGNRYTMNAITNPTDKGQHP